MAAHILSFQRAWRRWLDVARITLGLVTAAIQLSPGREFGSGAILTLVFTGYAVFLAFMPGRLGKPGLALLCLFADAVFFLAFSAYCADPGFWLASFFYCYLLISGVVCHEWADVFIVSGVCIVFFAFMRAPETEPLRRVVLFGGVLACAVAFQKRKLQERLDVAGRNERSLREELARASDAERQRIAGDFHDGPLQDVISLQIRLDILRHLLERDRAEGMKELAQLQDLAKVLVAELRSFLRTMRPVPVEGSDLVTSVRRVTEEFQKDTGIPVRFTNSEPPIASPPETCVEILQIVREALYNVHKHAQAGRVAVSLEKAGKAVEISVDDNGVGFAFGGSFTLEELELLRLGPQSIARRVRGLGGDLLLESRPGQGAGLKIRVPAR